MYKMIKELLNEKRKGYIPSGKFSVSSIGSCWRKKYLELKGLYKEEFDEQTQRIFTIGNVFHREIIREIIEKEAGSFHLVAAEVNIPIQKYFSGRIDAIVSNEGTNMIVDVKSAGDWTIKNVREKHDCDEGYKNQVLLYMHFTGIHKGVLLFVGKTKGEIEEIEVEYDEDKSNQLVKEVEDFFVNYVEKDIEPPRCVNPRWSCKCCNSDISEESIS